ncbi:WXG100 family type VII secretion target [Nocardia sp. NPDC059177]|uniref:WXG100 family type VII secretion target n=1 Tax=Nocardia sp. NPDC059177 TaxID=3346759 RepID=UPI0036BF25AC
MSTLGTSEQEELAKSQIGTLTPAQVAAWQPSTLTDLGTAWSTQAQQLTTFDDTEYRAVDDSRDFWTGSAATAMRDKHGQIRTTTGSFIAALEDGATAAQTGASTLDAAKTAVVNAVKSAESNGYEVGDDGTVKISTSTHQTLLSQLDASSYTVAAGALQVDADASTTAVKQALENARTAATSVQTAIENAFAVLPEDDSTEITQAGPFSELPQKFGESTWQLINRSNTLTAQLAQLTGDGWSIEYGKEGEGSYTVGRDKKIVLDGSLRNNPEATTQVLAHEAGHASYKGGSGGSTQQDCVNALLTNEGAATLNNISVQREILANGGSDIGVAGQNPDVAAAWTASYDKYRAAGSSPEAYQTAIYDIGQYYGDNLHPSTAPNLTYRQYYESQCK